MLSFVYDCWEQSSRDGTASRRLGSGRSRSIIQRENRRIRCRAVVHRSASASEIRAAVGTTVKQRTVKNQLIQGQHRTRRPVSCISLIPSHCCLRPQAVSS
ncbi:uncharacterized protein TNCV_642961 [Trichonephila clavipes]|nr:uncharacterized protein TNCV_642961 [Trichonephila clavipes]